MLLQYNCKSTPIPIKVRVQRCSNARIAYGHSVKKVAPKTIPSRDRLLADIRGAGLRATASRIAVLGFLHTSHRPVSHAEVVEELKEFTWDRSTLYRNLVDLYEAGLVRRSEVGDRTWRFEIACDHGHPDHVAHFLCRDCGYIACLPELVVSPKGADELPLALTRGDIEVQVLGSCDTCISPA